MWHTNTIHEFDLVKAQEMGLKCHQTFGCAVLHFGDIPAQCFASVVGHDKTILYERFSKVAPSAPAIQADRASGDRLLDQDQQQKRLDIIESFVNFFMQSPNKDELTKELLQYQQEGTEVDERTAELYSTFGNTDIMIIDEMTQFEACKEHNAKGLSFCTCGSILPGSHKRNL